MQIELSILCFCLLNRQPSLHHLRWGVPDSNNLSWAVIEPVIPRVVMCPSVLGSLYLFPEDSVDVTGNNCKKEGGRVFRFAIVRDLCKLK